MILALQTTQGQDSFVYGIIFGLILLVLFWPRKKN